mmetsp:Transcript_17270/g.54222  ORF Transcript_17270/g.54222 Transcript_17270/m.54222 type:complete len:250 (-) Transcript_17270:376-1125(-)
MQADESTDGWTDQSIRHKAPAPRPSWVQRGRGSDADVLEVGQGEARRRSGAGGHAVHHDARDRIVDAPRETHPVDLDLEAPRQPRRGRRGPKACLLRGDSRELAPTPLARRQLGVHDGRGRCGRCCRDRGGRDAVAEVLPRRQLQVLVASHARGDTPQEHVGSDVVDTPREADVVYLQGGDAANTGQAAGGLEARLLRGHLRHALVRAPGAGPQFGEVDAGGRGRGRGGSHRRRGRRCGDAVAEVLQCG